MQCSCGGETRTRESVKSIKGVVLAKLEWEACKRCERTSMVTEYRRQGGKLVPVKTQDTGPQNWKNWRSA